MEYDNELQGALFRNDKKSKETDRDFQGEVTVEGKEYWISSWINEGKEGRKYFKLKLKPKDDAPAKPAAKQSNSFTNEDIPF
jgi:hypothetical protein